MKTMSFKTVFKILIILGIGIAIFEQVPQRVWHWFEGTELGGQLHVGGSAEQRLPGPLRGLLDPNATGNLSAQGVVNFTNIQRDKNGGLTPLHFNKQLAAAAESKIDDMFAKQYFEHESPDGKTPANIIKAQGYEYIVVGENLALGNFANDEILVQAWMNSPGHRDNILNSKFAEIGVAVRQGQFEGKTVWLAVQEFGSPLSACPSPKKVIKTEIDANNAQIAVWESELRKKKAAMDASQSSGGSQYNQAVSEYNALARQINNLSDETKQLVEEYNNSVNDFNNCLESNA